MNLQAVTFNLSHSHGLCLMAIGRARSIGIDVERIRPDLEPMELARRYFTREECAALEALPVEKRATGFFLAWTRKEAYVKALGDGLEIPLDRFSVTLDPDRPAELDSHDSEHWKMQSLSPAPQYAAALVIECPVKTVSLWNLG